MMTIKNAAIKAEMDDLYITSWKFDTPKGSLQKSITPDVCVLLGARGLVAIEVMASQGWHDVGRLADIYQALKFHHLICFKVARVGNVDALLYLHLDFVRSTGNICCFAGLNVHGHQLVDLDLHPPCSSKQLDRLLDLLNYNDHEWRDYTRRNPKLPQLKEVIQPPPADSVLTVLLYGVGPPLVSVTAPIPVSTQEEVPPVEGEPCIALPIQHENIAIRLDLKLLAMSLMNPVKKGHFDDWEGIAKAGYL